MAHPCSVIGTWEQYKAETARYWKWLRETSPAASPTERLQKGPPTTIPTARIEPLTHAIVAAKNPAIEIPLSIIQLLQDVIARRRAFARWFKLLVRLCPDRDMEESNSKHQHFIGVLERSYHMLRTARLKQQPKRKQCTPDLAEEVPPVPNIYQLLYVEDTDEQYLDSKSNKPASRNPKAQDKTKCAGPKLDHHIEDDPDTKAMFACWALLRDLQEIRQLNQKTWKRYLAGEISDLTAADITNRAIHISVMLQEQLTDNGGLATYERLVASLHISGHETKGDEGEEGLEELLCFESYSSLYHFRDLQCFLWCEKGTPRYRVPAEHGVPLPTHPFSAVLLAIFRDLQGMLPKYNDKGQQNGEALENVFANVDQYTSGLLRLANTGSIDIAMVSATQMHMDMYDALGGDMALGLRKASKVADHTDSVIKDYALFYANASDYMRDQALPSKSMTAQTSLSSNLDQSGWRITSRLKDREPIFVPRDLLAALPLLSMMQAKRQLRGLQILGTEFFNNCQSFLTLAHLYRATKEHRMLSNEWPELEMLLSVQRDEFLRPSHGIASLATQFNVALGASLNKSRMKGKDAPKAPDPKSCDKNAKKFHEKADLAHGEAKNWDLHASLELYKAAGMQVHYEGIKEYLAHGGAIRNRDLARQYESTKTLTPPQLLTVMADIMVEEEAHLQFDYVRFYMSYVEVLLDIRSDYCQRLKGRSAQDGDRKPMTHIAHSILWSAAVAEKNGSSLTNTTLYRAGKIISKAIEQPGDAYSKPNILVKTDVIQAKSSFAEAEPSVINDMLKKVHGIHSNEDLDNMLACRKMYFYLVSNGRTQQEAAQEMSEALQLFNKHNVDTKILFAGESGELSFKQMKELNKIPHHNVGAAGGGIAPEEVGRVLKSQSHIFGDIPTE